jgi:hypothetical protein
MELAQAEWVRNAARAVGTGGAQAAAAEEDATLGVLISAATLSEAQRLATIERARKLRLENNLREGSLVELSKVNREAFEAERIVREAILNLPARLSAELAGETDSGRVYLRLDAALREALNAAAHTLETSVAG